MDTASWNDIKEKIYYYDGSWRDIYVPDTTQDDWSKWIDLVNARYPVSFYNGQTEKTESSIYKNVVFAYFNLTTDLLNDAVVKLGSIDIKCHFFTASEIENDIDPREIDTIENHMKLVGYLVEMSKALNRTVILTAENLKDEVYISVNGDSAEVKLPIY